MLHSAFEGEKLVVLCYMIGAQKCVFSTHEMVTEYAAFLLWRPITICITKSDFFSSNFYLKFGAFLK